jgi:WD40 repeat protein
LWNRRRIGLLLPAVLVLPWLPIFGPPKDATPAKRVRGVGDVPILSLAFAPDGATIATIQADWKVTLRDAAWEMSAHSVLDHRGPAQTLAFSPDGRTLAASSYLHNEILLWDIAAGRERDRLRGHVSPCTAWRSPPMAGPWPRGARATRRSSSGTSPPAGRDGG